MKRLNIFRQVVAIIVFFIISTSTAGFPSGLTHGDDHIRKCNRASLSREQAEARVLWLSLCARKMMIHHWNLLYGGEEEEVSEDEKIRELVDGWLYDANGDLKKHPQFPLVGNHRADRYEDFLGDHSVSGPCMDIPPEFTITDVCRCR